MARIMAVKARELFVGDKIGIEAMVATDDGCLGVNLVTPGLSVGIHEADFLYDGGARYGGKGVLNAVHNVNEIIAPLLKGVDVTDQSRIDQIMLDLYLKGRKIGYNSISSVSGAVVKAAAKGLGLTLYEYLGRTEHKVHRLPVPVIYIPIGDSRRVRIAGGKPDYSLAVSYTHLTLPTKRIV